MKLQEYRFAYVLPCCTAVTAVYPICVPPRFFPSFVFLCSLKIVFVQEMLDGETEYVGRGYWREVRLAKYDGQRVAIKTLRDDQDDSKRNKQRHRWEAVALDQVRDG